MSPRLDTVLVERGETESRTRAQALIRSGAVTVNGNPVTKASFPVGEQDSVTVSHTSECPYVSRGGYKLEAALRCSGVAVAGLVCADIGASSGGFTDCLLQHGAVKVYAIDSGRDQLHHSLREDPRVISVEGCNARYLSSKELPEIVDLMVMDVSFISQTKLYASILPFLKPGGILISLIKPQFEVGRSGIGKGGIVKDDRRRKEAVEAVIACAVSVGLCLRALTESPIRGGDGNLEYLAHFEYQPRE